MSGGKKAMNITNQRSEESTSIYLWKVYYIFSYLHYDHQDTYEISLKQALAAK